VFVLHVPSGSPLSGAQVSDGSGRAVALELAGDVLQVLWRSSPESAICWLSSCSIRNHSPGRPDHGGRGCPGVLCGRAPTTSSRMLRPRPCLYAARMAGDMTCGICGPLRFGLTGDAWGGGWFLALVVPEIPA
jgi:hypothetical protein